MATKKTENQIAYEQAMAARADRWVVACGGTETPTRARNGREYLYVYNPARHEHGWLDLGTDIITHEDPYTTA